MGKNGIQTVLKGIFPVENREECYTNKSARHMNKVIYMELLIENAIFCFYSSSFSFPFVLGYLIFVYIMESWPCSDIQRANPHQRSRQQLSEGSSLCTDTTYNIHHVLFEVIRQHKEGLGHLPLTHHIGVVGRRCNVHSLIRSSISIIAKISKLPMSLHGTMAL